MEGNYVPLSMTKYPDKIDSGKEGLFWFMVQRLQSITVGSPDRVWGGWATAPISHTVKKQGVMDAAALLAFSISFHPRTPAQGMVTPSSVDLHTSIHLILPLVTRSCQTDSCYNYHSRDGIKMRCWKQASCCI